MDGSRERERLDKRREGKLREALGKPLLGETLELLDRIGEGDRLRAYYGLVAVVGADGRTSSRYIDALDRKEMEDRLGAQWLEEGWLRQRAKRRRIGDEALSTPKHLVLQRHFALPGLSSFGFRYLATQLDRLRNPLTPRCVSHCRTRFRLKKQFGSVWRRSPRPATLSMYTSIELGDSPL